MRIPLSNLRHPNQHEDEPEESAPPVQPKRKTSAPVFHPSPGLELDLRGMTAEDIIQPLEKYLDDAVLAGLPFVRIIHGKGTGKLRQKVRRMLLDSPQVKFIEKGKDSEGGEGVTVAHLRSV